MTPKWPNLLAACTLDVYTLQDDFQGVLPLRDMLMIIKDNNVMVQTQSTNRSVDCYDHSKLK